MSLQINSKAVIDASFGVKRVVAMMLNNALVWQRSTRRLPLGYTELEWLNTNNGYLNTGITYEACTVEQDVKFESDTRRRLIGWSTNNSRYWGVDASNRYEIGSSVGIPAEQASPLDWHNVKFTTNGLAVAPTVSLLIDDTFSAVRPGSGTASGIHAYDYITEAYRCIAYFKFIKKTLPDGTIKNNLVPALRDSDNAVGFYDLITKEFNACENAIAGPALYLPSTYTELEYIENADTNQYIFLPIKWNTDFRFKVDMQITGWTTVSSSNYKFLFGSRLNASSAYESYLCYQLQATQFVCVSASNRNLATKGYENFTSYQCPYSSRHVIELKNEGMFVDDTKYQLYQTNNNRANNNLNIALFAISNTDTTVENNSQRTLFKLYGMWAKGTDREVKLVPARRNLDGAVGLYDTVGNEFYNNNGTGEFIAGPTKGIPDAYEELEYIEGTGTQFIDTGYKSTPLSKWEVDFQSEKTVGSTLESIFGAQSTVGTRYISRMSSIIVSANTSTRYVLASPTAEVSISARDINFATVTDANKRYKYSVDVKNYKASRDSDVIQGSAVKNLTTDYNVSIMARCTNGEYQDIARGKLYGAKHWEDDIISQNLRPARRKSDRTVGLYDIITGRFLTNAGTGAFIAGPIKQ